MTAVEIAYFAKMERLDHETVLTSVAKTHRAVVAHEGWPYGGVGAEVVDRIQRLAFDELDAPVLRVTGADVPMPYNAKLEQWCLPQPETIAAAGRVIVLQDGRVAQDLRSVPPPVQGGSAG